MLLTDDVVVVAVVAVAIALDFGSGRRMKMDKVWRRKGGELIWVWNKFSHVVS